MAALATGRDATGLFESYHIRDKLAATYLSKLPRPECTPSELAKLVPFDIPFPTPDQHPAGGGVLNPADRALPQPGDSEMYQIIKERVRNEVLAPKGKVFCRGGMRQCMENIFYVGFFVSTASLFVVAPSFLTGALLGVSSYFIGQNGHMASHGAVAESPLLSELLAFGVDLIGTSAQVWRYFHDVAHHLYTNDEDLDIESYVAFPVMRMHAGQPRKCYHRFQWLYVFPWYALSNVFLAVASSKMMMDRKVLHVRFLGITTKDVAIFWILKCVQFSVFLLLPYWLHRTWWVVLYYAASPAVFGTLLGATFLVNHKMEVSMPHESMAGDWCEWQIATSVSYGGRLTTFLQAGLNLQIEHHLFPSLPANLLPDVIPIVKDECLKRGLHYNGYDSFAVVLFQSLKYLYAMGKAETNTACENGIKASLLSSHKK